jgi:hypothetical protein
MSKSAQSRTDFLDGVVLRDLFVTMSRALDQSPKEVEFLHRLGIRVLRKTFGSRTNVQQHVLVKKLYPAVLAEINSSKKAKEALDRIVERYGKLPSTKATRLAQAGKNSLPVAAVGVGLAVGLIGCGLICLYMATHEGGGASGESDEM